VSAEHLRETRPEYYLILASHEREEAAKEDIPGEKDRAEEEPEPQVEGDSGPSQPNTAPKSEPSEDKKP
jgi:hypothetical protein